MFSPSMLLRYNSIRLELVTQGGNQTETRGAETLTRKDRVKRCSVYMPERH